MRKKFGTRYFTGTQRREVAGVLLAIYHRDAVMATESYQTGQRYLGCVWDAAEHRLPENGSSNGHAIETAHKFSTHPGFNTVRPSCIMQLPVGRYHVRHNPCPRLGRPRTLRTGFDHPCECRVDANFAARIGGKTFQRPAQRAVDSEVLHLQDHSRIRAPPKDRLACAEPWKYAGGIGTHQRIHVQCPATRQQTGCRVCFSPSLRQRGKFITRLQPRQAGGLGMRMLHRWKFV